MTIAGTANSNSAEAYDANNETIYDETGDLENKYLYEENLWVYVSNDKAIDKLIFDEGIAAEGLWFEQQDQDLIVKILGTDDQILIQNWYEGKGYRIEEFHTSDGRLLLEAEVNKMVQAMAAFSPQAGSESHLTAMPREQLESVTGNQEINVSAMMIAYIVRNNVESRG